MGIKDIFVRNIIINLGTSNCKIFSSDGFYLQTKSKVVYQIHGVRKPIPFLLEESFHMMGVGEHSLFIDGVPFLSEIAFMVKLLLARARIKKRFLRYFQKEKIILLLPYSCCRQAIEQIVAVLKAENISSYLVMTELEFITKNQTIPARRKL